MKFSLPVILIVTFLFSSLPGSAFSSSRVNTVVDSDVTERLETIYTLKKSMKDLNVQLSVYSTALEEAKKNNSHKKLYTNTRKVADAITALTILGGAIASYRFKNEVKVVQIASFIGGLSSSTSVLTSLLADLSSDEANTLQVKVDEVKTVLKATNINLNKEIKLLCLSEPSNQMCR